MFHHGSLGLPKNTLLIWGFFRRQLFSTSEYLFNSLGWYPFPSSLSLLLGINSSKIRSCNGSLTLFFAWLGLNRSINLMRSCLLYTIPLYNGRHSKNQFCRHFSSYAPGSPSPFHISHINNLNKSS